LAIRTQCPCPVCFHQRGDDTLAINAPDTPRAGDQQVAFPIKYPRTYEAKLSLFGRSAVATPDGAHPTPFDVVQLELAGSGKGDHLPIRVQSRYAGYCRPSYARKVDIIDKVESALPVKGHRLWRNLRFQRRDAVLYDAGPSSYLCESLWYADDARGRAVGFEAVDQRGIGHIDTSLGA